MTNKTDRRSTKLPSVKATPQELAIFKSAADTAEMSFSDFCRYALESAVTDNSEVIRLKGIDTVNRLNLKIWGNSPYKPAELER